MRNILLMLLAFLPFSIPTLYNPTQASTPVACVKGFRTAEFNEALCVPCESGTYNHGGMPWGRTTCYPVLEREIVLVNSTAVECNQYWKGNPVYIDGEYQYGCVDVPEPTTTPPTSSLCGFCPFKPTPSPILYPTRWPTRYPTRFPTRYPTRWPTGYPTRWPSKFPIQFPTHAPSSSPSIRPSRAPTLSPTLQPSSVPTKAPTKKKIKPTSYPSKYPTDNPSAIPTVHPTLQPTIPPSLAPEPPPPVPPHTIIIHHNDGDAADSSSDSTNKYDMAIAGIVVSAITLIIGGVFCYKKKMKKYKVRWEQEQRERNIRLSSSIELPTYRPDPYMEAGAVAVRPLPKRAPTCNTYPVGKMISDDNILKKAHI